MIEETDSIIARAICLLLPFLAISLGGFFAWLDTRRYRDIFPDEIEFDDEESKTE